MKKLLTPAVFLIAMCLCSTSLFAQSGSGNGAGTRSQTSERSVMDAAPTTMEEYTYGTKGIRTQLENGLDLTKNGYIIDDISTYRGFTYYVLIRKSSKEIAGMIVESISSNSTGLKVVFFMPNTSCLAYADDEVKIKYTNDINALMLNNNNLDKVLWQSLPMLVDYLTNRIVTKP